MSSEKSKLKSQYSSLLPTKFIAVMKKENPYRLIGFSRGLKVAINAMFAMELYERPLAADIIFVKHDSSIFRQSSNLYVIHGGAKPVLCGPKSPTCSIMSGLDDCLNMQLSCFRKRVSGWRRGRASLCSAIVICNYRGDFQA